MLHGFLFALPLAMYIFVLLPFAARKGSIVIAPNENIRRNTLRLLAPYIALWIYIHIKKEARYQPAIKAQALCEGLQAHRLENLSRYETHFDRKFERTLAIHL